MSDHHNRNWGTITRKSQEITTDLDIFQLTIILMRVGVRGNEPIMTELSDQSDEGEKISAAKAGVGCANPPKSQYYGIIKVKLEISGN